MNPARLPSCSNVWYGETWVLGQVISHAIKHTSGTNHAFPIEHEDEHEGEGENEVPGVIHTT